MRKKTWGRIVSLKKVDRGFDIAFWQAQSATARFNAAFDMLKYSYLLKGKKINDNTFRLQKHIERLRVNKFKS